MKNSKILEELRGMMLHSHLYGCAKDLCEDFPFELIESKDVVERICKAIHKRGAISVGGSTYHDFLRFLPTKRG